MGVWLADLRGGCLRDLRKVGTCPVAALADTEDPTALARLIEVYHDYPSKDLFFSLMENAD
jgi:hypothetical protein